jgi:ligand-binding sensor domain-containing protein
MAAGTGGDVWIGTPGGLVHYMAGRDTPVWEVFNARNSALPSPQVLGVAVDPHGITWAATGAGGAALHPSVGAWSFTDRNAPLLHSILDAVWVDGAGRVWFGGAGGVNVYRPPVAAGDSGDWVVGFTRNSSQGGLPDDLVYAILEDAHGRMWFGTAGGVGVLTPEATAFALGAYDPGRWQTFTTRSAPLVDDKVHALVEDQAGRIWIGTEQGISVVSLPPPARAGEAARWERPGGDQAPGPGALPHPWVQALAVGPDGRMWAGTRAGLAVYDPAQPAQGWRVYRANPLRRWLGYLWPAFWRQNVLANDVTALTWARG